MRFFAEAEADSGALTCSRETSRPVHDVCFFTMCAARRVDIHQPGATGQRLVSACPSQRRQHIPQRQRPSQRQCPSERQRQPACKSGRRRPSILRRCLLRARAAYWHGRWWAYGVGSCWRITPDCRFRRRRFVTNAGGKKTQFTQARFHKGQQGISLGSLGRWFMSDLHNGVKISHYPIKIQS